MLSFYYVTMGKYPSQAGFLLEGCGGGGEERGALL